MGKNFKSSNWANKCQRVVSFGRLFWTPASALAKLCPRAWAAPVSVEVKKVTVLEVSGGKSDASIPVLILPPGLEI